MPPVVTTYPTRQAAGYPGMVASMNNWDGITRICETDAGLGFGLAVSQGTADNQALLGAAAAAGFIGLTIRDITLINATVDKYADGQNVGILTQGEMWATVGGDVVAGGDVTFNATTGVLSSAAASGSQFAIVGARWMTSALSGGLARVRLSGHLPAA